MSYPNSIEAIEARLDAATPWPWGWRGNVDTHNIHLRSLGGVLFPDVLRFHRSGMQGGKPVFNVPGNPGMINVDTDSLVVYQVCPEATDRDDRRVYRGDIIGIRHPDAELIANAPEDIAFLIDRVRELEAQLEQVEMLQLIEAGI